MTIYKDDNPVGIVVKRDEERSGEVQIFSRRLEPQQGWARVIPHLSLREIHFISCIPHNWGKFAPTRGDGILIRKELLTKSGLLTRKQEYEVLHDLCDKWHPVA